MPHGRPIPEPTPEEVQALLEKYQDEITELVSGDMSSVEKGIEDIPPAAEAYNSLTDEQKDIVRWQAILTNAVFVMALLKGEPPYAVAGNIAGAMLEGEMMWTELITAIHAEQN